MKFAILPVLMIMLACTGFAATPHHSNDPDAIQVSLPMTVHDVIKLTQAGVSNDIILSEMEASHSRFQLKPQDILDLKQANVNDGVITVMLLRSPENRARSYDPPGMRDGYDPQDMYYPVGYGAYGYAPYYGGMGSWYPGFGYGYGYGISNFRGGFVPGQFQAFSGFPPGGMASSGNGFNPVDFRSFNAISPFGIRGTMPFGARSPRMRLK